MLTRKQIITLFEKLNEALKRQNEIGEIGIVGGAVMCLVYQARASTKDVDAIFEPADIIRKLAAVIAVDNQLPPDWLNDGVKNFLVPNFIKNEVLNLSNLRIWAPESKYMLAMKCISARWDTHDRDDVIFLISFLKLKKAQHVFNIIQNYYPKNKIPPKTQFFIEELFDDHLSSLT
ncbi:MAG: hypothetical protein ISR65_12525 [Bacteriovoracaceae bacterium]|nr:hypothetical protein [Bacteriovoracaceae bacterium]